MPPFEAAILSVPSDCLLTTGIFSAPLACLLTTVSLNAYKFIETLTWFNNTGSKLWLMPLK